MPKHVPSEEDGERGHWIDAVDYGDFDRAAMYTSSELAQQPDFGDLVDSVAPPAPFTTETPTPTHARMGMGAEDYCVCGRTWPHETKEEETR